MTLAGSSLSLRSLGTSLSFDLVVASFGRLTGEARIRRAFEIGFRHKASRDTGEGPGPSSFITGSNRDYGTPCTARSAQPDFCWSDSFRMYKS